jgi:LysR family transcriptional regulator, transcriptional activator of the cysJI operon
MLNLQQLSTFVTVLSEGSMTAAADKLFLTQPAVSQQIRNLEEELGVDLLVRGVRQIKSTPQGEILYEHAKRILQLVGLAEVAIKSMGADMQGILRIGTLNSLGLHLMSPIMSRLLKFNPDLSVKVQYEKGEELIRLFKKGSLDILILPDVQKEFNLPLEGVEHKFLLKEEMWLVGSGTQIESAHEIDMVQIKKYPLVLFSDEYPRFHGKLLNFMKEKNARYDVVFESSNVGTLKRVIESGLGWGWLPAHSVKKQVRSGRLIRIHVKEFHYESDLIFYYRAQGDAKVLAENFYDIISHQERV